MSQFRPGVGLRIGNRVVTTLLRAGLPMGSMTLLTVPGRRTGLPRTTPVAVARLDRGLRLVAPYGEVDWVKNLRVAGQGTLTRGRRRTEVGAVELSPVEAAPLLRDSLAEAGPIVSRVLSGYFEADLSGPHDDWVVEAERHPVFILSPIGD